MERRALLAVVLMIGVVILSNVLFPPAAPPPETFRADSPEATAPPRVDPREAEPTAPGLAQAADVLGRPVDEQLSPAVVPADGLEPALPGGPGEAADTIRVQTDVFNLRFSTIGAAVIGAELTQYDSYVENGNGLTGVELVRAGDRLLQYAITLGRDTVPLQNATFEPSERELLLRPGDSPRELEFTYRFPGSDAAFVTTYRFTPGSYVIETEGRLEGVPERGYTVLVSLGNGLRTNEKNPDEDHRELAYVVKDRRGGIRATNLDKVKAGQIRMADGGPFRWVAIKNKYFLVALVADPDRSDFGGLVAQGVEQEHAAAITASMPVPAGTAGFAFETYLGPQDYGRLEAVGEGLQNVNPYGFSWIQPIMRPLVAIVLVVLTWLHSTLNLAYGWVLVVFGVMMRVILFPLYQKSMRSQMEQMAVQPLMKDIQARYKEDPQRLQQEMVKLYKEHHINPLSGCLPMLVPMPILFTLFFVFQGTIEFRGVPFLWLPDLSLKDPLYIIPLVMGASMFLVQRISQRGMEMNAQMKMMGWAMPVFLTFIFLNFASGLNLYYTTSNLASLPQQIYLSRERRAAHAKMKASREDSVGKQRGKPRSQTG